VRRILLLLLFACGLARADGSLVIIGGALRDDNAAVWEKVVQLAGGKGARIAVFPSAAGNPLKAGDAIAARLRHYGAEPFVVALSPKRDDYRALADDAQAADSVARAGGVYFSGGDQGRITQVLRRADGSNTRMLDAIWSMYKGGGVIAGTSAGAAIMSTTMFHDAKPVVPTLKQGVRDGKEIAPGLGFIGPDVFIDQHLLVRGRFARMLPVMVKKGYKVGLGIDENSALVVSPAREVEIVGYKGAMLVELSAAARDPKQPRFNLANARVSYLDQGDRYHLATGALSTPKERLDAGKPYFKGPLFSADIAGNTAVADLIEKLVDSDQQTAIGIAVGSPREPDPELGFEFVFTRVPETAGYMATLSEAYSVHRVRLDVRPIRVRQPLYQPYKN
jgi:cyanophycinase